jgi:hypothetical protein
VKAISRSISFGLVIAALALTACGAKSGATTADPVAKAEPISGSALKRVTLVQKGAERLGLQMAPIQDAQVRGAQRKVMPYAAIIYDAKGETWAYTAPEPVRFVRQPIKVDFVDGDKAVLLDGPPSGTPVVTVGAAELLGVEIGVGK